MNAYCHSRNTLPSLTSSGYKASNFRDNSSAEEIRLSILFESLFLIASERRVRSSTIWPQLLPFSGETGCYYDVKDSVLVLRTANQNIWYYKGNNRSKKQRKHQKELVVSEYRCPISQEARQSFNRLFTAAVFSSSFLATPFGADGVTYEIRVRGGSYSAECWSPKKDSNCGQLVEFLAHLSEAIKGNDPQMIESLIPLADALSLLFEALYPEDVKENSTLLIWE